MGGEERGASGVDGSDTSVRAGGRLKVPVEVVEGEDLHLDRMIRYG